MTEIPKLSSRDLHNLKASIAQVLFPETIFWNFHQECFSYIGNRGYSGENTQRLKGIIH